MKNNGKKWFLFPAIMVFVTVHASALEVPQLRGRVNDYAELLGSAAEAELESYLAAVEQSSGAQIALLTINSLEGDSLERFSLKVAEKWGIGSAETDDGALLLVSMADKKVRIEVGYGLEATLTDAVSGYIIRETIVPNFRRGNFEAGIAEALRAMGGLISGDVSISAQQIQKSNSASNDSGSFPIFFILFIIIFMLSRMGSYRRMRRRGISPGTALFMGMMLGGSGRYRSGGSGFSSGGFGGGFSGGGGGFGGGGASGGW